MGRIGGFRVLLFTYVLTLSHLVLAEGLTNLPTGVYSPMLLTGVIEGLDQVFNDNGGLSSLTADSSIILDSQNLVKMVPEAKELIDVINSTGQNNAGDALHLGVIELDIKPKISYYSPILAYGVSKRLTIGIGLPIINYTNTVNVKHYGSNVDQFAAKFGNLSEDLSDAFSKMNSIAGEFSQTIIEKGYKPLSNRNKSFTGDAQINAQYILWGNRNTRLLSKTTFTLPTGPKDDPDDLLALNKFGRTAISQKFVAGRKFNRRFTVVGKFEMRFPLPDETQKRVPASADDFLPGVETKETVKRQIGLQSTIGLEPQFKITSSISGLAGIDYTVKQKDKYSGGRGQNYGLLATNTDRNHTVMKLGLSYSTVKSYFKKEAFLPAIVSYEFKDTLAGRNTEKQTSHELLLTLFYK